MQNDTWLNKIEDSNWYQGFTRGDVVSGYTKEQIYQIENGELETTYTDLVDGEQQSVTEGFKLLDDAKIGLMNMTDYNYALKKDGYNCYGAELNCSQNWLHNFGTIKTQEHIIDSYGYIEKYACFSFQLIYYNWDSHEDGYIMDGTNESLVRPVFFLVSTININGLGMVDNPYIIK